MRKFQFRTKPDEELKEAIDKLVDETKDVADFIYFKKCMEHQGKRIIQVMDLEHKTDSYIYGKYQYKRWGSISKVEREYLKQRFGFSECDDGDVCTPVCITPGTIIGEFFDKNHLLARVKPFESILGRFREHELVEIFEELVLEINRRKAQREKKH